MSVSLYIVLLLATLFRGTLQLDTIDVLDDVLKDLQDEQNEAIAAITADVTHDGEDPQRGWRPPSRPEFFDSYLEGDIEDPADSSDSQDLTISSISPYHGWTSHKDFIKSKHIRNEGVSDSSEADESVKPRLPFMRLSVNTESGELNQSYSQMVGTNLNELVDFVIDVVQTDILKKGIDQIPIADINEEFSKRIGFIKVKGKFVGRQGWFKRLSTLHRTANVIATKQGDSLIITCGMGLGTMEFGFDRYEAKFLHLGPKGKLRGKVDSNSINVQVSIALVGGQCKITLQQLKVTQFNGLSIHATGLDTDDALIGETILSLK